jgi:perosamine synthetase
MKYPLNLPFITKYEKKFVNDVLKKNWISVNGEYNKIFENKFGKIINKKYNLSVQSGTAALHLALKALNIKEKDYVLCPNYSCSANINSISQVRAKPILIEVENETLGLDYEIVKKAILKFKPKALQLVHVYGFPARDTLKIIKLCKKKKIYVIEDASEALGAMIKKKPVGSFGDISMVSLRSEKMIGVGEGAMISTNNKNIFKNINLLACRNMPFRSKNDLYWKKYISKGEGYNYLMPHILAAIGVGQLKNFKKIINKKIKVGNFYRKEFKDYKFAQKIIKGNKVVFWLNVINLNNFAKERVRKLGNYLIKNGIEVRSGFWPLNNTPNINKIYISNGNKYSKEFFEKFLVLPSNINLNLKDIRFIKKKIQDFFLNN